VETRLPEEQHGFEKHLQNGRKLAYQQRLFADKNAKKRFQFG